IPKRRRTSEEATDASGEDLISSLPDAVLQVVLSFLPSDETVRTCVLARRWRHLWKSTPALRIIQGGMMYWNAKEMNNFVNYLLLFRDRLPLDECEISYSKPCDSEEYSEIFRFANMRIHYAVSLCQTKVLKVCIRNVQVWLMHGNSTLMSQFLRRVELTGVTMWKHSLDFSSCPTLEDLNLCSSRIYGPKISSQSVRCLSITQCQFNVDTGSRMRISAPCLVYLQLADVSGTAPLLERMPLLVTAFIRLGRGGFGTCTHEAYGDCDECFPYDGYYYGHDDYGASFANYHGSNDSVLLQGLSGATSLGLTTIDPNVFTFRKDLKQCPTFSMLKTLLLNEWCVAADFGALVKFLQCTPILEKLIIQLRLEKLPRVNSMIETYESYNPAVQLVLKHLKDVEIKCHKEDEVVRQIVKILSTFGVLSDQIDIQVIQQTYVSGSKLAIITFHD
uniref:F-box domain-containing protein n=1 Tax=Aegilops tauschii subsp. strangulata TaxID=200361 RepID=A0A453R965_AEGTS